MSLQRATLVGGQVIWAHDPSLCGGRPCAVHRPSRHHMRGWPQNFRDPEHEALAFGLHPGLMERICPHGVGHPDPDHMRWYATCHTEEEVEAEGTHGCDGCCASPCRCWGCGTADDLMSGCGSLCFDCSWEDHLAGIAHTGEFDEVREGTPECCVASRAADRARLAEDER